MKKLFCISHTFYKSIVIKSRTYIWATCFEALIDYLSSTRFEGFGVITKIEKVKEPYVKGNTIKEVT